MARYAQVNFSRPIVVIVLPNGARKVPIGRPRTSYTKLFFACQQQLAQIVAAEATAVAELDLAVMFGGLQS